MRVIKKQPAPHTIYIACEGAVSERRYFEAIRDEVQNTWDVTITVYPEDSKSPNDATALVNLARKKSKTHTEVWAVFDKDGDVPTQALTDAAQIIDGRIVNVGYSSVAFEHWVLLHYEKNQIAYAKSDCKEGEKHFDCGKPGKDHPLDCKGVRCAANRIREKYIPDYNKKWGYNVYQVVQSRNEHVLENAAWLRHKKGADLNALKHATTNPYTNVDVLIRRLFKRNDTIIWGDLNQSITVGQITISVTHKEPQITVTLLNTDFGRFFIPFQTNAHFFLSNDDGLISNLDLDSIRILANNSNEAVSTATTVSLYQDDSVEIQLKVVPSLVGPLYLNFVNGSERIMFGL